MSEERDIRIGDRVVHLESLSSFKVVRGGKALSRITRQVSGLDKQIQEFVSTYREANTEKVTRTTFEYRQNLEEAAHVAAFRERLAGEGIEGEEATERLRAFKDSLALQRLEISDEAWAKCPEVVLTRDPTPMQIGAFLLPQVLDSAEDEVLGLLALITSPDSELRDAKREGRYEEYIAQKAEDIQFDADIEDLLELAASALDVLGEKLRGKAGRLRQAWTKLTGANQESPEPTSGETSNSTSSTDSDPPTDGDTTSPSSPTGTPQPASSSA